MPSLPSHPEPLPPLSAADENVVVALIVNDLDVLQAATACGLSPATLLALTTRPDIAAYLAAERVLRNLRLERQALTALSRLLTAGPAATKQLDHHNVEARRSANSVLRAIRHNPADPSAAAPRGRRPATAPDAPALHAQQPAADLENPALAAAAPGRQPEGDSNLGHNSADQATAPTLAPLPPRTTGRQSDNAGPGIRPFAPQSKATPLGMTG
jgi:hypothetical protein